VSVKAVVEVGGRVPLLRNERAEWELPGGRLEAGEQLEAAVEREVREHDAAAALEHRAQRRALVRRRVVGWDRDAPALQDLDPRG
jgi:hypothetical protein